MKRLSWTVTSTEAVHELKSVIVIGTRKVPLKHGESDWVSWLARTRKTPFRSTANKRRAVVSLTEKLTYSIYRGSVL